MALGESGNGCGGRSVIRGTWNNAPHAASWLFNITLPAGYQMCMGVGNCLPCGFASVHADVETRNAFVF